MKHFILGLVLLFSTQLEAQKIFKTNGIAIRGYDAVAYHTKQQAIEGKDSFTLVWSDATWRFSTLSNLHLFKANPQKYAPAYGGYCAYGVSEAHLSPTDPNAFTVVNDTLYFNYSQKIKTYWLRDTIQRIKTANSNWPSL